MRALIYPVVAFAVSLLAGLSQPPAPVTASSGSLTATTAVARPNLDLSVPAGAPRALSTPAVAETSLPATSTAKAKAVNCRKVKCIALTFDDGPVKQTVGVLNVLKKRGARATFFVLGSQATAHRGVLKRMVANGNAIGNHSWNHPQFERLSNAAIKRQLTRTNRVIIAATGKRPAIVRTPYGQYNKRIAKVVRSVHAAEILWSVDPEDWKVRNTKAVQHRVLKAARRNSIILIHDIHPTTRAAVPKIVSVLQARGYHLVTVPELLGSRLKAGRSYFSG